MTQIELTQISDEPIIRALEAMPARSPFSIRCLAATEIDRRWDWIQRHYYNGAEVPCNDLFDYQNWQLVTYSGSKWITAHEVTGLTIDSTNSLLTVSSDGSIPLDDWLIDSLSLLNKQRNEEMGAAIVDPVFVAKKGAPIGLVKVQFKALITDRTMRDLMVSTKALHESRIRAEDRLRLTEQFYDA